MQHAAVRLFLLCGLICFGASSCSPRKGRSGKYVIGAVLEKSGGLAKYGSQSEKGMKLAVEELQGKDGIDIELLVLDNASAPEQSAKAFTELAEVRKALCVLGAATSSNTRMMKEQANKLHVPMVTPSSTNVQLTKETNWLFRVCWNDVFQGGVCATIARDYLKARRVALLVDTQQDYCTGLASNFEQAFTAHGGTIVERLTYVTGDKVFSSQLEKLKALDIQAVFCPGYVSEVGLLVRQAREAGFDKPFLGGDGYASPEFGSVAGPAVGTGVYLCDHAHPDDPAPKARRFVAAYQERYHEAPGSMSFLGYDAIYLVHDALKRAAAQGEVTRDSLRAALAATRDLELLTGKITIGPDHEVSKRAIAAKYNSDGTLGFVGEVQP